MAQVITIEGERLFALKAQNNQQLDIDTFIFAFVPGQDSSAPIDRNEGLPPIGQRVHSQIVQQTGLINENAVVYSSVLDSLTGPFDFNWVGLYSSVNQTLIAIIHTPTVSKTVTVPGAAGNILNRNFVIEYSGIAELTGIVVDQETWQLDYTARLNGMDELTRQLAADMNGKDWFIDDGFKVVPRGTVNTFKVTAGAGYVSGLRVTLAADHILTLSSYPQFVYVDAWFDGDSNSVWKGHVAFTVTNTEMDDYIDVSGRKHYVCKIARASDAVTVEDLRTIDGLAQKIDKHIQNTESAHKASAISLAIKSILGNDGFSLEDVAKSYGVFVEEFRKNNESDSEVINKALAYIGGLPISGTRLVFEKGRNYTYDSTHYLGGINNLTLDLNGAILKRANGDLTASTLSEDIGSGQSNIWLTNIPNSWNVGDYLTAFSSVSNVDTSQNPVKILGIDKVAKKVTLVNGFGQFGAFTSTITSGTTIAKCYQCFSGRPSAPDPSSPFNPGINERIFIINGTIDGNSANQLNYSWRFIHEIGLHSKGGLIHKMFIKNVAGESIVGHGLTVDDNIFENLNGSCFHLSLNDLQKEKAIFSRFINNSGQLVNLKSDDVGHSEGMITFSWGAGNLIIEGNIIKKGRAAIIGEFGPKTEENADRLLIMGVNIFEDFKRIMHNISSDAEGVHIHDTIFSSCGLEDSNNYEVTTTLLKNASCSIKNCKYINTDANKAEECLASFIGSNIDKLTMFNKSWVQGRDIGELLYDIAETRVLEGGDDAYIDEDDKDTNIGYYKKNGSQFSEYFERYSRQLGLKQFRGNNTATAFEFITGSSTDIPSLKIEKDGTVHLPLMRKFVIGGKDEDGSWQFDGEGDDLLIQKKVGGAWVTKQTIEG